MAPFEDLTARLYTAWRQAIVEGKLINRFEALEDDLEGQWVKGDAIAFGLKQENQTIYYAQNLTQSRKILSAVEERRIDEIGFVCQFNGYRALRPGGQRRSLGKQPDISPLAEQCRFACQDSSHPLSLLVRQPLLEVSLQHFVWKAYYNAAPIEPEGHFLWVPALRDKPNALTHFPQIISLEFLEDALSLFQRLTNTLLFFNSLHSGASVNHIHFQAMAHKQPLPVESWPAVDCGGYTLLKEYPIQVISFSANTSATRVFDWIARLQQRGIPFNLMLAGDRIFLIPRNIEHEIVSEFPDNGLAALGMCGRLITINREAYLRADKAIIERAFEKMGLAIV